MDARAISSIASQLNVRTLREIIQQQSFFSCAVWHKIYSLGKKNITNGVIIVREQLLHDLGKLRPKKLKKPLRAWRHCTSHVWYLSDLWKLICCEVLWSLFLYLYLCPLYFTNMSKGAVEIRGKTKETAFNQDYYTQPVKTSQIFLLTDLFVSDTAKWLKTIMKTILQNKITVS